MAGLSSILGRELPPVTRAMLAVVVVGSILDAVLARWLGLFDAAAYAALVPGLVLSGQVWRLATYPWLAGDPMALIVGALMLLFAAAPMEARWGTRRFVWRISLLVVLPAVLTTLLGLLLARVHAYAYAGLAPLGVALFAALAASQRGTRMTLFPLPIVVEADQFLMIEGGLLGLYMLFAGTTVPFIPEVAAFAFALAWFRFGLGFSLRRSWRRYQATRAEADLARLRKKRGLRVVRDDDDEQGYLH